MHATSDDEPQANSAHSKILIILLKTIIKNPLPTLALLYGLLFLFLYPEVLLIADEKAYAEQALALSEGGRYLETAFAAQGGIPKHYPLGTALAGAVLVWLTGPKGIFLLGALSLLIAVAATASMLRRLGYADFWSALMFLYPPALLLSRQVMSELPSLAVLSVFFWLVFTVDLGGARAGKSHAEAQRRKGGILKITLTRVREHSFRSRQVWGALAVGFLAGVSLAFRETNLLLVAPFLAELLWRRRVHAPALLLGGALGLSVRLLSAAWVYGDWLYVKDPGAGFGFLYVPGNALIYGLALCVFIPLGLPAVFRYRGPLRVSLWVSVGLFTLFHLFYGYNGWAASGAYAFVLGPRFFVPALPLFVLVLADWRGRDRFFLANERDLQVGDEKGAQLGLQVVHPLNPPSTFANGVPPITSAEELASVDKPAGKKSRWNLPVSSYSLQYLFYLLVVLSIVVGQAGSHLLGSSHRRVVDQLYAHAAGPNYLSFNGPLWKYESSLYGELNAADISRLQREGLPEEVFYLHLMERGDTPERRRQSEHERRELDFLWPQVEVLHVDSVATLDGVVLRSFGLRKKGGDRVD